MKRIIIFSFLVIIWTDIQAQTPESFNYQAVIKDVQGTSVINQMVSLQLSILQGSATGTNIYTETHQAETNSYGLISLQVGEGTPVYGDFSTVAWGEDLHFIKVEADISGGTTYSEIGTMQLVSVPYALYAKDVLNKDDADANPENELQTLNITNNQLSISDGNVVTIPDADATNEIQTLDLSGDNLSISDGNSVSLSNYQSPWQSSGNNIYYNTGNVGIGVVPSQAILEIKASPSANVDDPLLQVVNKTGDTVFAVYDGGVKISFDENAKGNIGGFAVSGRTTAKGIRDYFTVSKDSTRVYVDQSAKGNIGGFAVSGRTTAKAISTFMDLTPENYLIGHESGSALTSGVKNTFIGYQSGISTTEGESNIFIGQESGMNNVYGVRNVFIGYRAGKENIGDPTGSPPTIGHDNIYIGGSAGRDNPAGEHNTLIGSYSGYVSSGTKNTFVGAFTGFAASGEGNVFFGVDAGRENNAGDANTFIGAIAGRNNSGNRNTIVGYGAGYNSTGDDNVFVGRYAGFNETGSKKLYVDISATGSPLIYGDFTDNSEYLRINGLLQVNTNNFHVASNPGSSAVPAYYSYQGLTASTLKDFAYTIHDALWITSHAWIDGILTSAKGTYQLAKPSFQNSIGKVENIDIRKVLELQAEYFMWDESKFAFKDSLPATKQIGLDPDQVEQLFPELVKTDNRGDKYINYSKLSIILLEALRQQDEKMTKFETRLEEIEQKLMEK